MRPVRLPPVAAPPAKVSLTAALYHGSAEMEAKLCASVGVRAQPPLFARRTSSATRPECRKFTMARICGVGKIGPRWYNVGEWHWALPGIARNEQPARPGHLRFGKSRNRLPAQQGSLNRCLLSSKAGHSVLNGACISHPGHRLSTSVGARRWRVASATRRQMKCSLPDVLVAQKETDK
jgi:hypothetical protein